MTPEVAIELGNRSLILALIISMPLLGLGLVVGVIISIFQSVTQIQEMTLTFVPKLLVTLLALIFIGPWMLSVLINFTVNLFNNIPAYIK